MNRWFKWLKKRSRSGKSESVSAASPVVEAGQGGDAGTVQQVDATETAPSLDRAHDRSLYKAILSSLYDAILILDEEGFIIGSNARAENLLGRDESELWSQPCSDYLSGINPIVLARIRDHVSTGRFMVLNANGKRKDGSVFPAEIAISVIHYLNSTDLLLSMRSLERRKKAEKQRQLEADAGYYAHVGIMICNRDGLIEYVNPACVRLLRQKSPDQILQHFLGEFCPSLTSAKEILQTPTEKIRWTGSAAFRTAPGETVNCSVTSVCIPMRRDGVARVALTFTSQQAAPRSFSSAATS